MSKLMAISPSFPFFLLAMECMVSKTTTTLSIISLLGMKALCTSLITLCKIFFSLFARTLDYITEADWAVFSYLLGVFGIRNQANICVIDAPWHYACVESLQYTIRYTRTNNFPIFLIKDRLHTIGAW